MNITKGQAMKKKVFAFIKKHWIIVGIFTLAIAGGLTYYFTRPTQKASASTALPVQTASAFTGNIVLQASGTGTLAPANQVSFGFGTSGQIKELDAKIGDHVEAGQVIGKMDDTTATAALNQAKRNLADLSTPAAIAAAEQAVAQAEVDVTNALASIKRLVSPDVFYWQGQVAAAQETLKTAQTNAGTSPTTDQQKQIDEATTSLNRAQRNLEAAKLTYINVYAPANFTYTVTDQVTGVKSKEVVPPSDAEIAAANAAYQLAIANQSEAKAYLDLLNGSGLAQNVSGSSVTTFVDAQTALQTAEDNLKATQLISPISGTVTSLTASLGDYVSASSIITVADLSQPYTIDAYFDAGDWAKIQAGYSANVVFDILPDETYTGKVTVVYPELDSSSNSPFVHVTVKLTNTITSDLPAGSTVSIDVISGQANNAVLIPVEALHQSSPGQYWVFVKTSGKIQLKKVDIGLQDASYAEVKSGLQVGDVVTTGIQTVLQ
jgi:RND family efflux transporter MFP subunit